MGLRNDVNLVWHSRGERDVGYELLILGDDSIALMNRHQHRSILVVNLVLVKKDLIQLAAPDTAFAVDEVFLCVYKLTFERVGNDRGGDYLRVRMCQRSAGSLSMI